MHLRSINKRKSTQGCCPAQAWGGTHSLVKEIADALDRMVGSYSGTCCSGVTGKLLVSPGGSANDRGPRPAVVGLRQ